MNIDPSVVDFDIKSYKFSNSSLEQLKKNRFLQDSYPVVYIIRNGKNTKAYIGESTNAVKRIGDHLKNPLRDSLDTLNFIVSDKFNKSATLDIESKLIKYISADGMFTLQNGNAGLSGHNYYQMDMYSKIFYEIWNSLRAKELVHKTIPQIENTNLFKYSPYKSLSEDQHESVLKILEKINDYRENTIFVSGAAGTGKSVLATYLMKLMHSSDESIEPKSDDPQHLKELNLIEEFKSKYKDPKIGLVVPMTQLRSTLKSVFKKVNGLNSGMVISPVDVSKSKFDILLVDEAHRLTQRTGIVNYKSFDDANKRLGFPKGTSQLQWILKQSSNQILFYDSEQSIRPADVDKDEFENIFNKSKTEKIELKSQMRVKGGNGYINFVDRLLNNRLDKYEKFESTDYDLKLFNSFEEFTNQIKTKDDKYGLCRLVAGYSWEWVTKNEPINTDLHDIEIEGIKYKWNSNVKSDWVTSKNAINEIGCIHTTQGYDLNYTGVIFGNEIKFDPNTDKIIIEKENYFDRNGKVGIEDPEILRSYIINIYKTLMFRGIKGTYLYVSDDEFRNYLIRHIDVNV